MSFTETFIEENRVQQNKLTRVKPLSIWKHPDNRVHISQSVSVSEYSAFLTVWIQDVTYVASPVRQRM